MSADGRDHNWPLSVDLKKQLLQSFTLGISVMLKQCAAVMLQNYIISSCDPFQGSALLRLTGTQMCSSEDALRSSCVGISMICVGFVQFEE